MRPEKPGTEGVGKPDVEGGEVNIEIEITKLLEVLVSYNDLCDRISPELKDQWIDAGLEAKTSKDRHAAKMHLKELVDALAIIRARESRESERGKAGRLKRKENVVVAELNQLVEKLKNEKVSAFLQSEIADRVSNLQQEALPANKEAIIINLKRLGNELKKRLGKNHLAEEILNRIGELEELLGE